MYLSYNFISESSLSTTTPSYGVIQFGDTDREYEMLSCDRILRGLWVPMMFTSGDVSQSLLNLQIPLQNRLLLGNARWADIARQVGRDRGTLHKNRDEGVQAYPGPPPADARARVLLDSLLQGPGAPVPMESLVTHLGDTLEWSHPTEEDSARVIREDVARWEGEGRVQLEGDLIHSGAKVLMDDTSTQDREAAVFMALPGLHIP